MVEPPQTDLLDKLIAIGIVLFILSLINEKITTLIRKYTKHASEIWLVKFFYKTLPKKENKEKEIILFSIIIGVVIAWLTNANLFELFKNPDPTTVLFVDPFEGEFSILKTFGILLTGFFLSFGTKFFHDLLDLLLQTKNFRRKLTDEKTYQLETIQDLDKYIATADGIMAEKAIKEHEKDLKKNFNVKNIYLGRTVINDKKKSAIIVHLKDDKSEDIPKTLPYRLDSGKTIDIPVEVVEKVAIPKIQRRPGVQIVNADSIDKPGAYGCLVKDKNTGDNHILTCSHVALSGSARNLGGVVNSSTFRFLSLGFGPSSVISNHLYYCKLNRGNDTALLSPLLSNNLNRVGSFEIDKERKIDPARDRDAQVFFRSSASSRIRKGQIHIPCSPNPEKLEFDDEIVEFENMILIGNKFGDEWEAISQLGDSGSVIVDENHHAIGVVVGGNSQFTYALPIFPILEEAQVTIVV